MMSATQRRRKIPTTPSKPIVGAQIETEDQKRFDEIVSKLGRSRSYVLRVAILRLIAQDNAGAIDWSGDLQKAIGD